jgi:fermentation-respiration switch protein FrsA (DUF1100 family)
MRSVTFPSGLIKMAGNLHLAKDFSKVRSYVAIVCVHPAGGVKEQTAGLYAAKLADEGMVALAYDASYQGESGGEPRQEEDPYARVEDVRAAVDYLTTLGFVDQQRICVLEARRGAGTRLLRGLGVLPHAASAAPKCAEHCSGAQPGSVGRLRRLSSGGTASDPAPPAHRGSRAGSLWFSQDAFRRAGSRDKSLHIVEGATHIAMYDTPEFVNQAMAQLVPLYQNAGKASSASKFVGPLSAHAATNVAKSAASPA